MGVARSRVSQPKRVTPIDKCFSLILKVLIIDHRNEHADIITPKGVPSMKHHMITRVCAILLTALLFAGIAAAQTKQDKSAPTGKAVTGSGCVEAGVEA